MIAGIDVGVSRCHMAILKGRDVVYLGEVIFDDSIEFVGIDAPLTMPKRGYFRECERELHKMGIRVIPPPFLRKIHEIGKDLARRFNRVFEVYPYATRFILGIRWSKRKKENRIKIAKELERFVRFPMTTDHNEIDAIISALTVKFYLEGRGEMVCGEDGCIIIPTRSSCTP